VKLVTLALIGNGKLTNLILYEGDMGFFLQAIALVSGWLFAASTFGISSYLWLGDLKLGFSYIIRSLRR
jgi:hypothetical protein